MTVLKVLLTIVEVLSSFLLLVVILIQRSKNQSMGLSIGAGMGEALFGAQMGNVLTKATVVLAAIFMATTTGLAYIGARAHPTSVVQKVKPVPAAPAAQTPPAPGPGQLTPSETPTLPVGPGAAPVVGQPGPVEAVPAPAPLPTETTPAPAPAVPVPPTPTPEAPKP